MRGPGADRTEDFSWHVREAGLDKAKELCAVNRGGRRPTGFRASYATRSQTLTRRSLPLQGSGHDLGGVGDPTAGYFRGMPGKLFAKVNHDANGDGPTFFTGAAGITFDTRIPALAFARGLSIAGLGERWSMPRAGQKTGTARRWRTSLHRTPAMSWRARRPKSMSCHREPVEVVEGRGAHRAQAA